MSPLPPPPCCLILNEYKTYWNTGWIYRSYPKPFECIIEGPDYEVFRAQTFNEQPSLPVISKVSMAASTEKYGGAGNDRIWQQRL
jgi:hypothetical protein